MHGYVDQKLSRSSFARPSDVHITAFPFVPHLEPLLLCAGWGAMMPTLPYFESTYPAHRTFESCPQGYDHRRLRRALPTTVATHHLAEILPPTRNRPLTFGPGLSVVAPRNPLSPPSTQTPCHSCSSSCSPNAVQPDLFKTSDHTHHSPHASSTSQPQNPHSNPAPNEEPAPNRLFDE